MDFKRSVLDEPGVVQRLEYDPNRSAYIALVMYKNGALQYILAPFGVTQGDEVLASRTQEIPIKPGNAMPLSMIPIGTSVHNVELFPGRGGQMVRSAGNSATVLDKSMRPGYALLEMPSKEQRFVRLECLATIGNMSNPLHSLRKLGKAGRSRWLGRRPHVRGVAMNPVDHPHGGNTAGGRTSVSYSGVLAKGGKTRRRHKQSNSLILVNKRGRNLQIRKQQAEALTAEEQKARKAFQTKRAQDAQKKAAKRARKNK